MGSRAQSRAVQRPTGRAVRVKAPLSARSVRSVSITEARQKLCPLLRQVDALPGRKVGITVSGDVAAYLVSAKKLDELEAKARQCPLLAALDTITPPDRQLPTYVVAVIPMTRHSTPRCLRGIGLLGVILGARQQPRL
jgi:prevent-host-death family protein